MSKKWNEICTLFKSRQELNIKFKRISEQELLNIDTIASIEYKTRKPIFGEQKSECDEDDFEAKIIRLKEKKAGITKPVEPSPDECCNSNCEMDCVMNLYYARLDEYEEIMMFTSTPSMSSEGVDDLD